ncbi:peptidoglycan-associated lipoprotein [Acinetobacter colistiniresistens]|uniref:Peptidoglycan-associated lipoprotein n=1 Tax=Acinetobacter colistiniresistens TaxID=280145 RepID=N9QU51_9GAMM|nr:MULTISPECIES: peptidoglycan-associated lipoprotein Pal [Acinetobacter]ENX13382.1 peptidoglycan-associated lipoprotein [Acinetobacter sp. CIP 64.2]ENX33546.1 peptidoglycan-associated lipoprotein [Acinetobacter colistiniresistens]EPG38394.1 peptidoglycan-associated lipoprotein [Acinetobacter colistiniresistens]TVT83883.1 peptidoglycan-associated lipoprotein Pal [Acinetobacter colistiniresistens]UUM27147.1 peptidoglycan-associated lipoprotein Pal [Acinetobacter colistiniresistens]
MNIKYLTLPLIAATLVFTGCASRKPAAEITTGTNPNGSSTVSTEGLSEDAALNAQNLAGASSKGVTAANKAFLAKRVVHFNYDSSDLSNEDYQTLQAHAQFLVANANSRVALTGHTDERGTREYNMALGERRAKAVESFLITNGVNPQQLEAVSYGKESPVNAGHDEAAWKENRRVEINYEAVPPLLK